MKCKNIECNNETIGKRIYCSMSCRNYYVNKYIRDYSKNAEAVKNSYVEKYIPNKCKLEICDNDIPYEYRENSYCSKDCHKKSINSNRKGLKYNISEETLIKYRESALLNFKHNGIERAIDRYNKNIKKCPNCECDIEFEKRTRKFCSPECRKDFRRKDKDALQCYRTDCSFKFSLKDYTEEFDFSLVEKFGWYSPSNKKNNLGGVSRDHMFSVKDGFLQCIDPKFLAHPANCKLMIHNENVSKNKNSSISIIELLQRIETFDKKYN